MLKMQNLSFFQQYLNNLITSSMNKLQKMHTLLKESKKLDLVQRLHKKHLYKSQQKQRKTQGLIDYTRKELYSSLVYMSPYNNEQDEHYGSRQAKRNKSTSEKKNDFFLTPMITFRKKRHIYFENVKNVSQMLTKPITRSVRFDEVQWDAQENERKVATGKRHKENDIKNMGENVFMIKPKNEKKMSEVRIRKTKKTYYNSQDPQRPQQVFTLCGWQTLNQQEL